MRIGISAIGKLKAGPETELCDRYLDRLKKTGPAIGLEWTRVHEASESRLPTVEARKREEAAFILKTVPDNGVLVVLDERGKTPDSPAFAEAIGAFRDAGRRDMVLAIGGPDGLDPELQARADWSVAFGRLTWPHQIVRVLLAEQLYRAVTILSGHPYHRV